MGAMPHILVSGWNHLSAVFHVCFSFLLHPQARAIASRYAGSATVSAAPLLSPGAPSPPAMPAHGHPQPAQRRPVTVCPATAGSAGGRDGVKSKVHGRSEVSYGNEKIDLSSVEQIVEASQTRAIAQALKWLQKKVLWCRSLLLIVK